MGQNSRNGIKLKNPGIETIPGFCIHLLIEIIRNQRLER